MVADSRAGTTESFHPAAAAVYFIVLAVVTVAGQQPLPLLLFLGAAIAVISLRPGGMRLMLQMGLAFVPLALFVTLVNVIVAPPGPTLLFSIPESLPCLGGRPITMETVRYGLVMALRVLALLAVFLAWDRTMDTDRSFFYLARCLPATALTVLMAFRLLPVMRNDFAAICEAHRARGLRFDGGFTRRWRSYAVVLRGLLVLSLERGLDIAEAMHARGFASGRRSCAVRYVWRPRDTFLAAAALALVLGWAAGGTAGLWLTVLGVFILPFWEWGCRIRPSWKHIA